jgi:HlyD family secretion protein
MKRIIVIPVLVIVGGLIAFYFWQSGNPEDGPRALVLYGNVDIREVDLAFRQPGRLLRMAVTEGAAVRDGEVLAELDSQPYRNHLAIAEADLRRATAEWEKLRRGNRPQEIERAREAVNQAQAVLRKVEADLARQGELAATGAASLKKLEAVRTAHDEATAILAAARANASLLREGSRSEDIEIAAARVDAAKAARDQALTVLEDTVLMSPSDGIVLSRLREPGSMVSSRDPVYTVSLSNPVYVRAYVSEPDLGRIAPATPVRIQTDSSDRIFHGTVGFISPRAEFTPKSVETEDLRTDLVYRLRIVVAEGEGLRQGMPVTITVATRADADTAADGSP